MALSTDQKAVRNFVEGLCPVVLHLLSQGGTYWVPFCLTIKILKNGDALREIVCVMLNKKKMVYY
jgi:hypothetical protein